MRIVIIIITLLWFMFGANLCKKNFCGESAASTEATSGIIGTTGDDCLSALSFIDKDGGLELTSTENFHFLISNADVMGTTSEMAKALGELTSYLNSNPSRFMEITGLYNDLEENTSDKDNLGKARAVSVRSYLISKGIDGKQLTTNGMMDNDICTSKDKILRGVKVAFNKIPSN